MRKTLHTPARLLELTPPPPTPLEFIARTPVFRREEFRAVHQARGRENVSTAAILAYHVRSGRLLVARRGLYVNTSNVDPWLLGSRLTEDAVIAYDGALSFHRLTGLGHQISYLTARRSGAFSWNEVVYKAARNPSLLDLELETHQRAGLKLTVTSRERALVDCLDRLDLAPPAEELVSLIVSTPNLDVDRMVAWAVRQKNRLLNARLGYVLSFGRRLHQEVAPLERYLPTSYAWFESQERKGTINVPRWHLMIRPELARAVENL